MKELSSVERNTRHDASNEEITIHILHLTTLGRTNLGMPAFIIYLIYSHEFPYGRNDEMIHKRAKTTTVIHGPSRYGEMHYRSCSIPCEPWMLYRARHLSGLSICTVCQFRFFEFRFFLLSSRVATRDRTTSCKESDTILLYVIHDVIILGFGWGQKMWVVVDENIHDSLSKHYRRFQCLYLLLLSY